MRLPGRCFALLILTAFCGLTTEASTITGTVRGPDHATFQGAFVEAQNIKSKITVAVLSDRQGSYRIENLPAGQYRLFIRAVGFRSDPHPGVNLTEDQNASFDFSLETSLVHWNDISIYQAKQLFPAAKAKDFFFQNCEICHGFQTRIASVRRDANGWKDRVDYMRTAMHFVLAHVTDQEAADLAAYLTSLFGPDSILPKSPADLPAYKATVRPFSSDSLGIVYVEYDMPGPSRMPFSAAPDKDGNLWIPNFGVANKITRLNPKTGEMQDFAVPSTGTTAVHSAVPAADGSVWLTEQSVNRIGRWDPKTQMITEYQDQYLPGQEGLVGGGSKHTIRIDPSGNVWASGDPLTKFDPETRKFTRFEEAGSTYDVKPNKNGDVWFTSYRVNKIGKIDGKTMKMSQWTMPTADAFPRRLEIAPDGVIWIGEYNAGKIARFDPNTLTFKEFPLPGPDPTPYGMGFDADGYLWYGSHNMDVLGRFDTKTGNVIEYPFPQSEVAVREFFRDSEGRMWFGTNPNNKVGYFYLAKHRKEADTN